MNDTLANVLPYRVDLNKPIKKKYLDTLLATGDHEAHRFDIELVRNGEAVSIPSGTGVFGYFIKHSNKEDEEDSMVVLEGSADGNVASIKLDKACYAKTCQFSFIIKVTVGEEITSVFWGDGTVMRSKTDTIEDPTNVVHDLDTLLAQIAAMEAATADGHAAAQEARDAGAEAVEIAQAAGAEAKHTAEEAAEKADEARLAIQDDLSQLKDTIASEAHVSGAIVTTESAMSAKPKALTVDIPYTAGGIMAITMQHRRRNMLAMTHDGTSAGLTYTPNADGSLHIEGTPTGNSRYGMWHGSYGTTSPLPPGQYEVYAWQDDETHHRYATFGYQIYEGTGGTKLVNPVAAVNKFTTNEWKNARAIIYLNTGTYDNDAKFFLGYGSGNTIDNWDAPATSLDQVNVSFDAMVYGGTLDVVNQTFTSLYESDGSLLADPLVMDIEADIPVLYEGANTLWCDIFGSTVHLSYTENRIGKLDSQITAVVSMIGSTEREMVATRNYAAGDFIVNKDDLTMYRATAVIATGETITPGTNCMATTVVEQLANLYNLLNA